MGRSGSYPHAYLYGIGQLGGGMVWWRMDSNFDRFHAFLTPAQQEALRAVRTFLGDQERSNLEQQGHAPETSDAPLRGSPGTS